MKEPYRTYGIMFLEVLFVSLLIPFLAFADITSPVDGDSLTDINTDFTLSGTSLRFALFGNDGLWICSDGLAAPYGTQSIQDLATAYGGSTLSAMGTGAYHILWINAYGAPECETNTGEYTDCLGSGYYNNQDICLNVGGGTPCDVVPPPSGGGGGATSTVEQTQQNLFNGFIIFFLSFFGMVWLFRRRV